MLRFFITYILVFFTLYNVNPQPNLVPNPGFEIYTECPQFGGQVNFAPPWYDPTGASSDYFNTCSTSSQNPLYSWAGSQAPYSGNSFMGFFVFINNGSVSREYIQVKLNEPLHQGIEYCAEFYVSLADTSDYAVHNLGCLFTDTPVTHPTVPPFLINLQAQIVNDGSINPLNNTKIWTKIQGTFIAQGGEQYLTIGNFYDDSQSDTSWIGGSGGGGYYFSYYYIDNVYVSFCNYVPPQVIIPNVFSPDNNSFNDVFFIKTSGVSSYNATIYNRWGIEVRTLSQNDSIWDGTYNQKPLSEGVYFLSITYYNLLGEAFSKQGIIHLFREQP
jgi:gliding motility-associated-like protein